MSGPAQREKIDGGQFSGFFGRIFFYSNLGLYKERRIKRKRKNSGPRKILMETVKPGDS
jgi:hypothetical protein